MERGEGMQNRMEAETAMTAVITADLGANNLGAIGPTQLDDSVRAGIDQEIDRPELRVAVDTTRWCCVDGRCKFHSQPGEAQPGQIAGSLTTTEVSVEFMVNPEPTKQSEIVDQKSKEAAEDGITVEDHGDEGKAEDGCGAKAHQRRVLAHMAENVDIVAPRAVTVGNAAGLDKYGVNPDEVVAAIVQGGEAAADDTLWDVTPKEAADIVRDNGGEYRELTGKHLELKAVVELVKDKTFDGTVFAERQIAEYGEEAQVFVVSLGAYVDMQFERGRKRGKTDQQIALECYAAIAFQIGVCKVLGNENLEAGLLPAAA